MKKHLLPILWLMILTLPVFAGPFQESKTTPDADSKNASVEKIDWPSALPMLPADEAIALGEIVDSQIENAFDEGYKKAELRFEPDAAYWKFVATQSERARFWEGFKWGAGTGAAVTIGLVAGVAVILGVASR